MASQNYYNNLDLRYAEIGIALQKIDRMNPGMVKFSIPVLTPQYTKDEEQSSTEVQKDKSNIINENKDAVDVSNLEISNTLLIEVPVELCSLPGAYYDITGSYKSNQDITSDGAIEIQGSINMTGRGRVDGSLTFNGNITGTPKTNGISGASFSGNGSNNGNTEFSGTGTMVGRILHNTTRGDIDVREIEGTIGLTLNEKSRYIEYGSRWLIMFIGGDIAAPVVVARIPSSAGVPVTEESIEKKQEEHEEGVVEVNNNEYDIVEPDQNPFDPEYEERDLTPWEYEVTEPDTQDNVVEVSMVPASADDIWDLDNVILGTLPTKISNTKIKENDQVVFTPMYEVTIDDYNYVNRKTVNRDKLFKYVMTALKYIDTSEFIIDVFDEVAQIRYPYDKRKDLPITEVVGSLGFITKSGGYAYAYPITLSNFKTSGYWEVRSDGSGSEWQNRLYADAPCAFIPIFEKMEDGKSYVDSADLAVVFTDHYYINSDTDDLTDAVDEDSPMRFKLYDGSVEVTYSGWPTMVNKVVGCLEYQEFDHYIYDEDGDVIGRAWKFRNYITDFTIAYNKEEMDQRCTSHVASGNKVTMRLKHDDMKKEYRVKSFKIVYEYNSNPDPVQAYTFEAYDVKASDFKCTTVDGSALINIEKWPTDVDAIFGRFECGELKIESQKLTELSTKVESTKIKAGATATFTPLYQVNNPKYGHPLENVADLKFDTYVSEGQVILQQTKWPAKSAYFIGKLEVLPEGYVKPKAEDTGTGEVTEWYIYNANIFKGTKRFDDNRFTMYDRVYFTPNYQYKSAPTVTTADVSDEEKTKLEEVFGDNPPKKGVHVTLDGTVVWIRERDDGDIVYMYDHENKKYLKCTVVYPREAFDSSKWDITYLKIFVTDGYVLIDYENWPDDIYAYRGCITCIRNGRKKAIEENNDNDYPVKNWNDDDVEIVVGYGFCTIQYRKNWPANTGRFEGRIHVKRLYNNGTKLVENDIQKQTIHYGKNVFHGNFILGDEVTFIPKYEYPKKPATDEGNDHPVTDWNRVYCTCTAYDGYVDIKYTKFPKTVSRYVGCLSVHPGRYEDESFMIYNVPLRDEDTRIYDSRIQSIDKITFDPVYQYPRGSTDFYIYNVDIGSEPIKILDNRFTDKDLIYFTCVYQYWWEKIGDKEEVPEGTETKEEDGVKYKLVRGEENAIDKYDKTMLSIFPQVGKVTLSYKTMPEGIVRFRGSLAVETNGNRDAEERVMKEETEEAVEDKNWYVYNFDVRSSTVKYEDERISMYDRVSFTPIEEYAATADNAKNRTVWNWNPKNVSMVVKDGSISISYSPWPKGVSSFVGAIVINSVNLDIPEYYITNAKLTDGVCVFSDSRITAKDSVTYVVSYEYDEGYDKENLPAETKLEGLTHYYKSNLAIFVTDGYILVDYKAFPKGISKFRGCISVLPDGNKEAILAGKKTNINPEEIVNIETNKATTTVNPINSVATRTRTTDTHRFIADVWLKKTGSETIFEKAANVTQRFIDYDVLKFIPAPYQASIYSDDKVKITLSEEKLSATFIDWDNPNINGKIILINRYKEFEIEVELPNNITTVYDERIDEDYIVTFEPDDETIKENWNGYIKIVTKGQVVIWFTSFPETDRETVKGKLYFKKLMKLSEFDKTTLHVPTWQELGEEVRENSQTNTNRV